MPAYRSSGASAQALPHFDGNMTLDQAANVG
jgi:hypothetical protein